MMMMVTVRMLLTEVFERTSMIFNRFFKLALSAAIVLTFVGLQGPAWCGEAVNSTSEDQADLAKIEAQLARKPGDLNFLCRHSELMGKMKRYEDEISDAAKIIAINPKLKDGYLLQAHGQAKLNQNAAAIASLNKAFEVGGLTHSQQILKARLLRREKRYSEAISIVDQVIKEDPSDYSAYDCRAGCYYSQNGPCLKAISDLEAVVRMNPSDVEAKALIIDLRCV